MNRFTATSLAILRSRKFFGVIIGLLVFQAAWMTLTARFPMAFDENFHFGVIQLYAHQWSPFFTSAPPNSAQFGDLVRNPSYLYQYLMSFPYRLIAIFIHQQAAQVIILRFLNIGLFTAGVFAFRTLLRRLNVSTAIIHLSLLMLVLIPVVPFLAGQINYDNLVFLIVPIVALLTLNCTESYKKTGILPPVSLTLLIITGMLGGLVKYAFLPILLALCIYLFVVVLRYAKKGAGFQGTLRAFWALKLGLKLSLIIGVIIAGGLFAERYGVNLVKYHSVQPDCARIESIDQCLQFGPWQRNYVIKANLQAANGAVALDPGVGQFVPAWAQGMMHRLYFAINYDYVNYNELPIIMTTAYVTGVIGLLLCCVFWRKLLHHESNLVLPAVIASIYVASLFYVNLSDYLHFKTMLAINGRYLILILPFYFVLCATAYKLLFERLSTRYSHTLMVSFTCLVLLLSLQGAGIITYIMRSDASWYWPNQVVVTTNLTVQKTLTPVLFLGQR